MSPRIHLLSAWQEVLPERLPGSTAVIIDVLSATTNVVTGLAHGAARFLLARDWEETAALAARLPPGEGLRAGEIGAEIVREFELAPLPSHFRSERIRGKTIILNTTNGTRAAHACRRAERVILAALVNARAVAEDLLRRRTEKITIVCAGNLGNLAYEDFFCGGLLADRLLAAREFRVNDAVLAARDVYRAGRENVYPAFRETLSSRAILAFGTEEEIRFACRENVYSLVPTVRPDGEMGLETRAAEE